MLIVAVIKLNGGNIYKTCFINNNQKLLLKGVVWKTYVSGCLHHEADQNQRFRKLSNCLEGVLNDLTPLSLCLLRPHLKLVSESEFIRVFTGSSPSEQIMRLGPYTKVRASYFEAQTD